MLKRAYRAATNWLLPSDLQCLLCEHYKVLGRYNMCERCQQTMQPAEFDLVPDDNFERLLFCFYYNDSAQRLIYRHKTGRQRYISDFFAQMIVERLKSADITVEVVTYVPTDRRAIKKRGCDHAKDITIATADRLGVPWQTSLKCLHHSKAQKRLSRAERFDNLREAYQATTVFKARQSVLLIDDIHTTGATMQAAAQAIKRHSPHCKLYGITVFYTP